MKGRNILIMTVITGIWMGLPVRADESARYLKAQKFLSHLHHTNQMEIEMGQMAKEKGNSAQVRAYGTRLIEDRRDADKRVIALAQKNGITLVPPSTSGLVRRLVVLRERSTMADLSKKTGTEFDKAFAEAIVYQQKLDINKLESNEYSFKQPDIRELIVNRLLAQEQHLELAWEIQRSF